MKSIIIKRIASHGKFDYLSNTAPCYEFSPYEDAALHLSLQQAILLSYALRRMRIKHYLIRVSAQEIKAVKASKIA